MKISTNQKRDTGIEFHNFIIQSEIISFLIGRHFQNKNIDYYLTSALIDENLEIKNWKSIVKTFRKITNHSNFLQFQKKTTNLSNNRWSKKKKINK